MATSVKEIRTAVERVIALSDEAMLTPSEIVGTVKSKSVVPSVFSLYRFIKRGNLKAVNLGTEDEPRYHVRGKDLKRFITERFGKI